MTDLLAEIDDKTLFTGATKWKWKDRKRAGDVEGKRKTSEANGRTGLVRNSHRRS